MALSLYLFAFGPVANNPFRMLPSEVMTNIKAMKSDRHPPTPTALLIKDVNFMPEASGLTVWTHPRRNDTTFLISDWHGRVTQDVHFHMTFSAQRLEEWDRILLSKKRKRGVAEPLGRVL